MYNQNHATTIILCLFIIPFDTWNWVEWYLDKLRIYKIYHRISSLDSKIHSPKIQTWLNIYHIYLLNFMHDADMQIFRLHKC